jgi:hypothetical protein
MCKPKMHNVWCKRDTHKGGEHQMVPRSTWVDEVGYRQSVKNENRIDGLWCGIA